MGGGRNGWAKAIVKVVLVSMQPFSAHMIHKNVMIMNYLQLVCTAWYLNNLYLHLRAFCVHGLVHG